MSTVNAAERDDALGPAVSPVVVEALALRADAHGRWSYRHLLTVPAPGESPDQAARRLAGISADSTHTGVHSTSWRYQPEGQIVLTYAVCPDPRPHLPAIPLADLRVARGGGPADPTPDRLRPEHVTAHAVTHLALLLSTDPAVHDALVAAPHVAAALARLAKAPAGELKPCVT